MLRKREKFVHLNTRSSWINNESIDQIELNQMVCHGQGSLSFICG